MKNTILKLSIICSLVLIGCNISSTIEEKENAWNVYFEGEYNHSDTLMRFNLSEDSLIIEFLKPTDLNYWRGQVTIYDSSQIKIYQSDLNNDNLLDTLPIEQGRIIFKDLNLQSEQLKECQVLFDGGPHLNDKLILVTPFWYANETYGEQQPGILAPRGGLSNVKYYVFNQKEFKSFKEDIQTYCREKEAKYVLGATDPSNLSLD
ncbi:MAG: hypothetical protein AB8B56_02260 [Crocinitomicaceae bacterium]